MPRVPVDIQQAYDAAVQELGEAALDGGCLEASVLMHRHLNQRGISASLVRYEISDQEGGHWTVRALGAEYDPTIGHSKWSQNLPGVRANALNVVNNKSPHSAWKTTRANTSLAYRVAGVPKPKR